MTYSILEHAAIVRQRKQEIDVLCTEMRREGVEWTSCAMAAEDAMKIAEDGLRNCATVLNHLYQIGHADLALHLRNAPSTVCAPTPATTAEQVGAQAGGATDTGDDA